MSEIQIFRLTSKQFQNEMWSHRDPSSCPAGRWNPRGVFICYAADSVAAATHELAVHIGFPAVCHQCSLGVATLRDEQITTLNASSLSKNWKSNEVYTQELGRLFVESQSTLALQVPSALLPFTFNYLLNPNHPEFAELNGTLEPEFNLDPRPLRRSAN